MSELREQMNITELHMQGFADAIIVAACREIVIRGMESIIRDTTKKGVMEKEIQRLCRALQNSQNWNGIRAVIKRRL